jgi:2'-5' RNA ligase superfamily
MPVRPLETSITLVLEHVDAELSKAHRELYPERIPEQIPFSITLLYPWLPASEVTDTDLEELRSFFATRPPLEFDLTHVREFPDIVAYAVPEPDEQLRAMMRALLGDLPAVAALRPARLRPAAARNVDPLRQPRERDLRAGQSASRAAPAGPLRRHRGHAPGGVRARPDADSSQIPFGV